MTNAFSGFEKPTSNFCRIPNQFFDLLPSFATRSELIVVLYILRHTWGFDDDSKKITLDEFVNGRKRKDGSRIDSGTGLTKPSVVSGIKSAVEHQFIIVDKDDKDKARKERTYSLSRLKNLTPEVKEFNTRGKEIEHRSEKDTIERHYRKTPSPAGADDGSEKREGEELPSFQESEQDVPKESQPDYEKRPWLYSRDSVSNDCFSGLNKVDQNTAIFNTVCYHIFGFTTSPHDHPRKSLEGKSASYIRKSIPDITPQRIQSAFEYYRATNKYADKLKDRDKMVSIIKDFERGNSAVVSGDPTTWTDDSHPTEEQCRQREDWTKLHEAWCVATGKPAWQALKHSETKLRYDATHYRESVQ